MSKKLAGVVFLAMFFSVSLTLLLGNSGKALRTAAAARHNPLQKIESTLLQQFPAAEFLRRLQISLKYMGGGKEQNHVFICDDALMYDVQPKSQATINNNTLAMLDFSDNFQRPSYIMLIPTACAVQQNKVPYAYDVLLYNQKQLLIDDVYRRVSGQVTAIDVFPVLRNHQDEYIYYRTENSPTGLGGYYIYTVAAKQLHLKPRGLEQFEIEHLDYQYYGNLYQLSPFREITPDRVSAYSYAKAQYSYTVTHLDQNGSRRYFTLYPKFKAQLGSTMDVLLGGMSPVMEITVNNLPRSTQNNRQLLIFGDRSVQAYLPFLMPHYARVTVVDTATVTEAMLQNIDVSAYNQVLFAYSADSFVEKDQLSILSKLPIPKED